ncbi:Cd2+/Zn2+-exporting ATPase [Acholeplasma morum]|uniref:heavy metal translocating P-type ATPase n=1 Tax=Paracholeplasma morum TaxID=264637 RepID=UPI00195E0E90|nr:heavy metal translocating P-type ATPase [Paracholeplasma morum]MBM7453955.1 Cd2+/Zn2+-exporting ATPase [Paracholeplasma morum]
MGHHHDNQNHDHQGHGNHSHGHHKLNPIYGLIIGFILYIVSFWIKDTLVQNTILTLAILISGHHVIYEGLVETLLHSIHHKRFIPNIHLLMVLGAIGAIIINAFDEAALLILIFAFSHILEDYADSKSHKELSNLIKLKPKMARLVKEGSTEIIDAESLKLDDIVLVLDGDQIPSDGVVVFGHSSVNESSITGESMPKDKSIGDTVYGSTINHNGQIQVRITKDPKDSIYNKITELVTSAQKDISKKAKLIKKFEPIYVTIILLLAPVFFLVMRFLFDLNLMDSFYRTMIFIIGSSPCALAVTDIPATLSGMSNLAKKGVLIKGGSYLSNLADVDIVALDKTGTITTGQPVVTDVYYDASLTLKEKNELTQILVSMESYSTHPIAKSIVAHFKVDSIRSLTIQNEVGSGLSTIIDETPYIIGNESLFSIMPEAFKVLKEQYLNESKTVFFFGNPIVKMMIALEDSIKEDSKDAISYFKQKNIKTVMLTGDTYSVSKKVGEMVGIDEIKSQLSPIDKNDLIKAYQKESKTVLMTGDGINDSVALMSADIGVSMGRGTDIAMDVSDIILLKDDLSKLSYAHKVSLKLRRIVWQNILFSMGVVLLLLVLNLFELNNIGFTVFIHEGSTLVVILNALRLLKTIK